MKTKKGFTLIEMIVVIILIGLVAVVAIPQVIKLMTAQSNEKYDTHMKLVKSALDVYTVKYKGDFDNYPNAEMYMMEYDYLDGELEPDDIECRGYITLTKKKGNTYKYDYYLKCVDNPVVPGKEAYMDTIDNKPDCDSSNKCVLLADPR